MLLQNSLALSSDTDVNYSVVAGFVGSLHVTIVTSCTIYVLIVTTSTW